MIATWRTRLRELVQNHRLLLVSLSRVYANMLVPLLRVYAILTHTFGVVQILCFYATIQERIYRVVPLDKTQYHHCPLFATACVVAMWAAEDNRLLDIYSSAVLTMILFRVIIIWPGAFTAHGTSYTVMLHCHAGKKLGVHRACLLLRQADFICQSGIGIRNSGRS